MTQNSKSPKVYVQVNADFEPGGRIIPKVITWENGETYEIDRILDICTAPAQKAGGYGDRYTVRIQGSTSYLFFERSDETNNRVIGRWFVERRAG